MTKILIFQLFIIFNINILAFSIDSLDFDSKLKIKEIKEKKFTITNTDLETLKYSFDTDKENVKIMPKTFILQPNQSKNFTVRVKGIGEKGDNYYYIIIKEEQLKRKNKSKNELNLSKKIKIEQKYILE